MLLNMTDDKIPVYEHECNTLESFSRLESQPIAEMSMARVVRIKLQVRRWINASKLHRRRRAIAALEKDLLSKKSAGGKE